MVRFAPYFSDSVPLTRLRDMAASSFRSSVPTAAALPSAEPPSPIAAAETL